MELKANEIMKIKVNCNAARKIGDDGRGFTQVIPIQSGVVSGKVEGKVLPGGSDWSTLIDQGKKSQVSARYMIETNEGELIGIYNRGKIDWTRESQKIRTFTIFEAEQTSKYAWLNTGVYVGALTIGDEPDVICITIYELL